MPESPTPRPATARRLTRRSFVLRSGAVISTFAVAPRHVLGGPGYVAPSEKVTLAYIGCGTQGLREMTDLLKNPSVQIVAVCDPVKDGHDYVDWSADGQRAAIAGALGQPDWRKGQPGIPGGRDVGQLMVETSYATARGKEVFRSCRSYADFRELLAKEGDVQALKIMTPDHLHATVALAGLRKGKQIVMHKPLANRLQEARWVVAAARQANLPTHFLAASDGANITTIKSWIDQGAIGTLREIHNWSRRPVWPQYPTVPTEQPPVPAGFDWDLWLGPALDRPYHPHYTHAVFRGWYDFGGGPIADMGHYSLWPVFQQFDLAAPTWVESHPSHVCQVRQQVSSKVKNDFSFPVASTVRFRFAAKGNRPALDLHWYDGGMRPPTPDELEVDDGEFDDEGMMFVGDQGRILAGFLGEHPRLLPEKKHREFRAKPTESPTSTATTRREKATADWVAAFRGGPRTCGDFLLAGPISDAFNLAAVSLRMGGGRLRFDAATGTITNLPEANRYLKREYRQGWELSPA